MEGEHMSRAEIEALMENIPDSYDDFVDSVTFEMEQDEEVCEAILEQLRINPNSNTSDVLKVLCDCLGMTSDYEPRLRAAL